MDGVMLEVWLAVQKEFSDIPDVTELTRTCVRLFMAILLGGMIGFEREFAGAQAGFRTHMLVALGAALFVLVPLQAGTPIEDMGRVLQGIIAGIGFLGAGAIMKLSSEREVRGLTTAASIWMTAAIGIAAGMGHESTAVVSTLFAVVILLITRLRHKKNEPDTPLD